jgi:NADPH:quinone reductase-like Zn-dependent oxidoreductase
VEVQVKAVGINFRDLLNVLGMYPGDPGAPGGDFAGIVARVPPGVASSAGLQPGDAVFGLAAGSLGSYVHVSSQTIVPMPASLRLVLLACCPQATCLHVKTGRQGRHLLANCLPA